MSLTSSETLEAIAQAIGNTEYGLTGSEINRLLEECRIHNTDPGATKWKRIFNSLVVHVNKSQTSQGIQLFIEKAMKPARHLSKAGRFEAIRTDLNRSLLLVGLFLTESGKLEKEQNKATTITEAEQRAKSLRSDLLKRDIHHEVLKYCKAELLAEDYFHVAHEAVKGIFQRLRDISYIHADGYELVDKALYKGKVHHCPAVLINSGISDSEKSEQLGFANMLKGIYSMFRNPTAHEPRLQWEMPKEDAEDLLSMVSLLHRRLDKAVRARQL